MQTWKNKWKMSIPSVTSIASICCFCQPRPIPIASQAVQFTWTWSPGLPLATGVGIWPKPVHGSPSLGPQGWVLWWACDIEHVISAWQRLLGWVFASTFLVEFNGRSCSSLEVESRLHVKLEMLKTIFINERWCFNYITSDPAALVFVLIPVLAHFNWSLLLATEKFLINSKKFSVTKIMIFSDRHSGQFLSTSLNG